MVRLDFDNGSAFCDHGVVGRAWGLGNYFTRTRPYTKNGPAMVESKNNHLVRTQTIYYR